LLQGLGALDEPTLLSALQNKEAGVRENAVQLAELEGQKLPQALAQLPSLQNDPSPKVRFQLLCSLGALQSNESQTARETILLRDIEDRWVQVAALASAAGNESALLLKILPKLSPVFSEGKAMFFSNCASVIALSANKNAVDRVFDLATKTTSPENQWWQTALLNGFNRVASVKAVELSVLQKKQLLTKFTANTSAPLRQAAIGLLKHTGINEAASAKTLQMARQVAANNNEDASFRADALRLLSLSDNKDDYILSLQMVFTDETMVQEAAVKSCFDLDPEVAATYFAGNWNKLSQTAREAAMDGLFSSPNNMLILLKAVENKTIPTTAISWPGKVQLMNYDEEVIRDPARKLLAGEIENRDEVIKQYGTALAMKGDTAKGRQVFTQVCGTCHQYEGKFGNRFGPDIATVSNRDKASIMTDILDPNRSIAVQYDLWTITLRDGSKFNGVLQSETPASLTLSQAGGKPVTISRTTVKSMETNRVSGMPVGLESSINKEQMAHLLAFIAGR
jgi:putative heme-binding domain-containing protein